MDNGPRAIASCHGGVRRLVLQRPSELISYRLMPLAVSPHPTCLKWKYMYVVVHMKANKIPFPYSRHVSSVLLLISADIWGSIVINFLDVWGLLERLLWRSSMSPSPFRHRSFCYLRVELAQCRFCCVQLIWIDWLMCIWDANSLLLCIAEFICHIYHLSIMDTGD